MISLNIMSIYLSIYLVYTLYVSVRSMQSIKSGRSKSRSRSNEGALCIEAFVCVRAGNSMLIPVFPSISACLMDSHGTQSRDGTPPRKES
jgi:hypothetical protein